MPISKATDRILMDLPSTSRAPVPKSHTITLLVIVALALFARVGAMVALQAWNKITYMEHGPIAVSLLENGSFAFGDWGMYEPSSVQSPPYPLLLAGLYYAFGYNYDLQAGQIFANQAHIAAMVINSIFGAISVWLTYVLVRTLGGKSRVGLLAAAMMAIWPTQIYLAASVQSIAIIVAASLATIILFYRSVDSQRLGPWIGYGVIGCLAALTEPVLLPFMAMSGLFILFWPRLPGSIRLRNAIVLFITALVILGPWAYRNYQIHGKLVPVKNTFWVNMWKANNPNASGTDRPVLSDEKRAELMAGMTDAQRNDPDFDSVRQYDLMPPGHRKMLMYKPEIEREAIFAQITKKWISENPREYLRLCALRLYKTLWVETDNPKAWNWPYVGSRTFILLMTPIGLIAAWLNGWRLFIPLMVMGTGLLTYTLTIAAARFAFPYEPFQLSLIALVLFGVFGGNKKDV
jgi:Dolichyl-phosphate-mannose-protein mannosyltransferase